MMIAWVCSLAVRRWHKFTVRMYCCQWLHGVYGFYCDSVRVPYRIIERIVWLCVSSTLVRDLMLGTNSKWLTWVGKSQKFNLFRDPNVVVTLENVFPKFSLCWGRTVTISPQSEIAGIFRPKFDIYCRHWPHTVFLLQGRNCMAVCCVRTKWLSVLCLYL